MVIRPAEEGDVGVLMALIRELAEYEKLTTFDPTEISVRLLVHPFGHLRLARLYEERGLREKAVEQYGKALAFWVDADEGLLPVEEAREALKRLQSQQ